MSKIILSEKAYLELLAKANTDEKHIKEANTQIANKIEEIKTLINDIKHIVETTGVKVRLDQILQQDIVEVCEFCEDWNSSGYYYSYY